MSGPDVMGREEVAHHLGVSLQRVSQLLRDDPLFPKPENDGARKLARGLVWDGPAIRAYAKDRRRPDPKHTKVLQSYRKTGSIAQAARTADVHVSTARRVLIDVGLIAAPQQHGMVPGSHERPGGPECRCGAAWLRFEDSCASGQEHPSDG